MDHLLPPLEERYCTLESICQEGAEVRSVSAGAPSRRARFNTMFNASHGYPIRIALSDGEPSEESSAATCSRRSELR